MSAKTLPLAARLAGFYFFFFALTGITLPYWSPYLLARGFNPAEIGLLLALGMSTKLFAPYLWGALADRSKRRMAIVRLACLCALISFSAVYWLPVGLLGWGLLMFVFQFFWNATLPQFEATTLNHLGTRSHRYSWIRLWGSVGFILSAMALGFALEHYGIELVPHLMLILFAGLLAVSFLIPEAPDRTVSAPGTTLLHILRQPAVLAFLLVCLLLQASHGPYYTFFTIQAEAVGYSGGMIGFFWALGVIAEVGIFIAAPALLLQFGARNLLLLTLLLTALRWLITAFFITSLPLLLLAQSLHGFSFGLYHAVAMTLVHRYFTGAYQGRGQALLSSFGFGLGGALGSFLAGQSWQLIGPASSYQWSYLWAAASALIAWLIAWRWLH